MARGFLLDVFELLKNFPAFPLGAILLEASSRRVVDTFSALSWVLVKY